MQNKRLLKNNLRKYVPSKSFDELIRSFMDKDFVISEKDIKKFLTQLHLRDNELNHAKYYSVKTINDVLIGGYFSLTKREIAISVTALLNLDKDASPETVERYKLSVLVAYFHETRHEKQTDEAIDYLSGRNNSAFAKVFASEYLSPEKNYDPFNTLIEIDARLVSIRRVMDLEKRGVYNFKPECYHFVMLSLWQMLDGINAIGEYNIEYNANAFDCVNILERILLYPPFKIKKQTISFSDSTFVNAFIKEYEEKFSEFEKVEYRQLIEKMFLNANISNEFRIKLTKLTKQNFLDKKVWDAFIKFVIAKPVRAFIYALQEEKDQMNKDKNDIIASPEDIVEYYREKYKKVPDNIEIKFLNDMKKHKKFEKWLREKRKKEQEKQKELEKELEKEFKPNIE